MIDWPSYNRSLVRRGEILFSYDFLDSWGQEIERMNKNKKGKPFVFPDSFILPRIHTLRISTTLQTNSWNNQCYWKESTFNSELWPNLQKNQQVTCRYYWKKNADDDDDDDYIIISIDSSGAKITNRVQFKWMDKKWKVQNRKGYLKIHIAVNIKTKEILGECTHPNWTTCQEIVCYYYSSNYYLHLP